MVNKSNVCITFVQYGVGCYVYIFHVSRVSWKLPGRAVPDILKQMVLVLRTHVRNRFCERI